MREVLLDDYYGGFDIELVYHAWARERVEGFRKGCSWELISGYSGHCMRSGAGLLAWQVAWHVACSW